MEILKWLDQADGIEHYEVQDFRQWAGGLYYKIKVVFIDQSTLFAREYADEIDRRHRCPLASPRISHGGRSAAFR